MKTYKINDNANGWEIKISGGLKMHIKQRKETKYDLDKCIKAIKRHATFLKNGHPRKTIFE